MSHRRPQRSASGAFRPQRRVSGALRRWPLLLVLLACGRGSGRPVANRQDGGGPADARIVLPHLMLGMPDIAAFSYRQRGGHAAFQRARTAEANDDWPTVASACRDALTADPDHLDAAYLLAVALAKTGATPTEILAPLTKAVAGDFAKWGSASLEQPALQPFLSTPSGTAWRQRVDEDRRAFVAALSHSLIVTSDRDLFAYDAELSRWYRLTRTSGAVVAALAVSAKVAYVTRQKLKSKHQTRIGVGIVDLDSGRSRRPIDVAAGGTVKVGFAQQANGFVVTAGKDSWSLVEDGALELRPLPPKPKLETFVRIEVTGHSGHLVRETIDNVSADWDEHGLASAMRIGSSHRVVTVPSPGLIDRNTAIWSPDRTQLAFVAQLDDTCKPGTATAAAFVADAATGNVRELERAVSGIAIEWLADRRLAIAGDHGVSSIDTGGGTPIALAGADGLVSPRRKPRCSPEPVGEEPAPDEEPEERAMDAGVR